MSFLPISPVSIFEITPRHKHVDEQHNAHVLRSTLIQS